MDLQHPGVTWHIPKVRCSSPGHLHLLLQPQWTVTLGVGGAFSAAHGGKELVVHMLPILVMKRSESSKRSLCTGHSLAQGQSVNRDRNPCLWDLTGRKMQQTRKSYHAKVICFRRKKIELRFGTLEYGMGVQPVAFRMGTADASKK